jgi:hypothetical protein
MSGSTNLYQQMKDALTSFDQFVTSNTATLSTAVTTLKPIVPQVGDLLTKLTAMMVQLKTAVNNINVASVDGLTAVSQLTSSAAALLQTAEQLLPAQKAAIDDVLGVAQVVSGLPSFSAIKTDIVALLDKVIGDLGAINGGAGR